MIEVATDTSNKRLAMQAYEQVLDLILNGGARPGDMVNERRLAEMLDMSRTPVRDALLMLEAEGLLERQGGRGLRIKQMQIEDYMDALQIRLMLEPEVARMATGRIPAADLDALEATLKAMLADAEAGAQADRAAVRDVDDRLHGLISDATENRQLSSIILMLRRQTQIFDLRSMPERFQDTAAEHLDILRSIRSGDAEAAATAMRAHLEQVRNSIINRLTRR